MIISDGDNAGSYYEYDMTFARCSHLLVLSS